MKEILQDRYLPCLQISEHSLGSDYYFIDDGLESRVYYYNDETVLKIFTKASVLKYSKIKLLALLKNDFFVFPQGFVGFESGFKEGYFMQRIQSQRDMKNFNSLYFLNDIRKIISIFKLADEGLEWAHHNNIIIGDIHEKNILINKDSRPKFCDTDNYMYLDYDFDLIPKRIYWLIKLYGKEFPFVEIDKFLYGLMCLRIITRDLTTIVTKEHIQALINNLNFSDFVKNGFKFVLSDSENRPYMQEILNEMENESKRYYKKFI